MNEMKLRRKHLRTLFLLAIGTLIVTQIVALSPSTLEENRPGPISIEPEALILDHQPSIIKGFPRKQIAEYGVEDFRYVSVQNGIKQWRIEAKYAFLYNNPERLVHARELTTFLFDPQDKITDHHGRRVTILSCP
jgi:hypothetical protein